MKLNTTMITAATSVAIPLRMPRPPLLPRSGRHSTPKPPLVATAGRASGRQCAINGRPVLGREVDLGGRGVLLQLEIAQLMRAAERQGKRLPPWVAAHIVAEVAKASGMPMPRVYLIESPHVPPAPPYPYAVHTQVRRVTMMPRRPRGMRQIERSSWSLMGRST